MMRVDGEVDKEEGILTIRKNRRYRTVSVLENLMRDGAKRRGVVQKDASEAPEASVDAIILI